MVGLSRKRVFPKTKGDSITGQDRAQKHCDFRFSQIEKKSKVAVLQLTNLKMAHNKFEKGCIPEYQQISALYYFSKKDTGKLAIMLFDMQALSHFTHTVYSPIKNH